jgi:hypothetical protein
VRAAPRRVEHLLGAGVLDRAKVILFVARTVPGQREVTAKAGMNPFDDRPWILPYRAQQPDPFARRIRQAHPQPYGQPPGRLIRTPRRSRAERPQQVKAIDNESGLVRGDRLLCQNTAARTK